MRPFVCKIQTAKPKQQNPNIYLHSLGRFSIYLNKHKRFTTTKEKERCATQRKEKNTVNRSKK
jgi:hypothetical protein